MSSETPLSVRDLTVAYRDRPALWDVDLEIRPARLTAIVGPNGAGKSTLLKGALGLVKPSAGTVSYFGRPLNEVRHRVGYVPQRESVDWDFPTDALDVVTMGTYAKVGWFRRSSNADRAWAMECLDALGMADYARRQIGQLSGGQQQRVFLARALAQNADLYLMDEPLAGVDAVSAKAIFAMLQRLKEAGKSCLIVHHDLRSVEETFDDVALVNVRLVRYGSVANVMTQEALRETYGEVGAR